MADNTILDAEVSWEEAINNRLDGIFGTDKENFCDRTWRYCVGGAWDGKDGWGIDCDQANPKECPYRTTFPENYMGCGCGRGECEFE